MTQEDKSIEHLLKTRYKVIAIYPGLVQDVGYVFESSIGSYYDQFPAVFRKLEWWEEREDSEMPKYVRNHTTSKVYKVADKSQNGRVWHIDGEIEERFIRRAYYLPATKSEYLTYINKKP